MTEVNQPKPNSRWVIRNVGEETQKIVKLHAAFRDVTIAEMLETIVNEWHASNPYPANIS